MASTGKLLFVKMSQNALSPTKGSKLAAGYDLKAAYEGVVPKRGSALIKTDIQIQLPTGTYGRVAPRSGLALKNKIDVGAGVIDEDYRGNVGVILFNHGDEDFQVTKGDRIAQLICEKICYPEIEEVKELDLTVRGGDGFGSTGMTATGATAVTVLCGKENKEPEPEPEPIIEGNEAKKPRIELETMETETKVVAEEAAAPATNGEIESSKV